MSPALALPTTSESDVAEQVSKIESRSRERLTKLWTQTLLHSDDLRFVSEKMFGDPTRLPEIYKSLSQMANLPSSANMAIVDQIHDPDYPKEFIAVSDSRPFVCGCGSYSTYNMLQKFAKETGSKSRFNQTEAIMLFDLIRRTADQLVSVYREYESSNSKLRTASSEGTIEQLTSLKKQMAASRERLTCLAGAAAVEELDKELDSDEGSRSSD